MRQCIAGDGTDVTFLVQGFMLQNNVFRTANLFRISPTVQNSGAFAPEPVLMTDWESPLYYNPPGSNFGVFKQARVTRGPIKFKVGFEADTLNLKWFTTPADTLSTGQTIFSAFYSGRMDNAGVQLWRVIMPRPGDANTYGAIALFAGRVGPVTIDRTTVTVQVKSFLDVLQTELPNQIIEPGDRVGQIGTAGGTGGPFLITQTTGTDLVTLTDNGAAAMIPADTYNLGFVAIGGTVNLFRTIYRNFNDGTSNIIKLYQPLPFIPPAGTGFSINGVYPKTQVTPALIADRPGFPFLPVPEQSL